MTMTHSENLAHPVAVPWMISPSVSGLEIRLSENGDTVVEADVATLPPEGDPGGELPNRRVEVVFAAGQWLRAHPAASDEEPIPPRTFDWSAVPFRQAQGPELDTMLEDFRAAWIRSQVCPDPGVYEILSSSWLRETGASRFGCHHYVVCGRDLWMEVLSAAGFSWRWSKAAPPKTIDTSSIE